MPVLLRLLALLAVVGTMPVGAQSLDSTFGGDGVLPLGFEPVGDAAHNGDVALVACAGPQGTLIVAGRASNDRRIGVAWLTENGRLDTRFGTGGRQSIELPAPYMIDAVGACTPDGKPVIAYGVGIAGGERDLRVLRIDPHSGRPDPTFGSGGTVAIDLDAYATDLGRDEHPVGLNLGNDGDMLLTGGYRYGANDAQQGGFVLRLTAAGGVAAHYLSHRAQPTLHTFSVAVPFDDGRIWAIAHSESGGTPTALVVRLHGATLAHQSTRSSSLGDHIRAYSGQRVLDSTMAIAAAEGPERKPVLIILETYGTIWVPLTVPALGGVPQAIAHAQVSSIGNRTLVYSGSSPRRRAARPAIT
jgi:hypothetical protein